MNVRLCDEEECVNCSGKCVQFFTPLNLVLALLRGLLLHAAFASDALLAVSCNNYMQESCLMEND